jgi:hypothetical protein
MFALVLLALSSLNSQLSTAHAQGTAFTYQGQLYNSGSLANGSYNLTFSLFNTNASGVAIAGPVTNNAVSVTNGLFTTLINFGPGVFTGATNWLQIGVETNGVSSFTTLTPRQQLTPTPYAIFAEGASAAGLSGTIPSANFAGTYGSVISFTNPASSFAGSGSGLTGLNAATLGGLASSNFWKTTGNGGTTAGVNFAGTTDSNAFEIHVNGSRLLRLEPDPLNGGAGNLIGGHPANTILQPTSKGDVIAGGGFGGGGNLINSNSSGIFIGAGSLNAAGPNVNDSVIAGGYSNTNQSPDSVIGGGLGNLIKTISPDSFIGGGLNNQISGDFLSKGGSAIVGGGDNLVSSNAAYSFIGGGLANQISGDTNDNGSSVIAGGYANLVFSNSAGSFIGGGVQNVVGTNAPFSTVGGGFGNGASGSESTVAGGDVNSAGALGSFIGGGVQNMASGNYTTVAGGYANTANGGLISGYATVAGGYGNNAAATGSFIGGGGSDGTISSGNFVNSKAASIVGGVGNVIPSGAEYGFIGGGYFNTNSGKCATVGGGYLNSAVGDGSVIAGGGYGNGEYLGNYAAGTAAVIGGGELNSIPSAGTYATIAGGH